MEEMEVIAEIDDIEAIENIGLGDWINEA